MAEVMGDFLLKIFAALVPEKLRDDISPHHSVYFSTVSGLNSTDLY